eukprot:TRINITY_DN4891_c0_g1_i2.p1 TRINITY_DN4891_c0_g1~~TRINITY_DN4891_c0_g1_i2.p1  ORF type:complete len:286 (+),score=26.59 TRINITY_DN4891_c0_g1_i2:80-859(+)
MSSSSSSSSSSSIKIGIIGFGPFAQFLAVTMIKQGHSLSATSRSDYTHLCSDLGIKFSRNADGLFEEGNDVILLCTSIISLSDILKSIPFNRLPKPTLFVDVLSVKEHPRDLLVKVLPEECDILCTHPMFGPESGKHGWTGLPFVYDKVRIRDENLCNNILLIFEREGCRMVELSCTEHDKLAARSQFLTHTIGRILSEMEIESTTMDTKGFETLLQLNSFDLYCGLFKNNKFAQQELEKLELALQTVKRKLLESTGGR